MSCSFDIRSGHFFLVFLAIIQQSFQFLLVSAEDVLLAASKIRMDLARQERILGNVGLS